MAKTRSAKSHGESAGNLDILHRRFCLTLRIKPIFDHLVSPQAQLFRSPSPRSTRKRSTGNTFWFRGLAKGDAHDPSHSERYRRTDHHPPSPGEVRPEP